MGVVCRMAGVPCGEALHPLTKNHLLFGDTLLKQPSTDILYDASAGWEQGVTESLPFDNGTLTVDAGGSTPFARPDLDAWIFAGQLSWGAAQTVYGAGTRESTDRGTELCIPAPAEWSSLEATKAMARRGYGYHFRRTAFPGSDKQSYWRG